MIEIYPNQKYIPKRAVIKVSSKGNIVKTGEIIPRGSHYQIPAVGMKGKILTTEIQKGMPISEQRIVNRNDRNFSKNMEFRRRGTKKHS